METIKKACALVCFMLFFSAVVLATGARAQTNPDFNPDILQGALLYDKWYAVVGVTPPAEEMPIWDRQSTNTRSGPDTWRCSECHGWDYQGAEGAYGSGSHRTGFPGVKSLTENMDTGEIVDHLKGSKDPAHDFSPYLDDDRLNQLAVFLKEGTIDDAEYIDSVSRRVIQGDIAHGQELYTTTCTECHGDDGKQIVFRTEGINEYLGSVAIRDPYRFLHRTRFSVAGTDMPAGYALGWTPEDGRDVLAYAQTLPTGGEIAVSEPAGEPDVISGPGPGGPATDLISGILTGLAAFAGMSLYAILFAGGFILMGVIVVTLLRKRK